MAFNPGGFSVFAPLGVVFDRSYDQEEVEGFEVGAKWMLADGRLRLNAAFYRYEYSEMQLSSFNAETLALEVQNAGASTVQGFEVDLLWYPGIEGLELRLGGNINDGEYDEFISPCWTGQTAAEGCVPINGIPQQDLAGGELPKAPDVTFNAGFTYRRPMGNSGWTFATSADVEYADGHYVDFALHPLAKQDSYARLDANISLTNENWQVSLIGRNLTEEWVLASVAEIPFSSNVSGVADIQSAVSRGRQLILELSYQL